MAVQRKCPGCGTWNEEDDHCTRCGHLLNPVLIEARREEERERQRQSIPPDKLDIFLHRWKHSRYPVLRVLYTVLYSIAMIFFAIASFFAWIAASPNG